MKRALLIGAAIVVLAALVLGGVQLSRLQTQVNALKHPRTSDFASQATVAAASTKEQSDVKYVLTDVIRLQARLAADERAQAGGGASDEIDNLQTAVSDLNEGVDQMCKSIQFNNPSLLDSCPVLDDVDFP